MIKSLSLANLSVSRKKIYIKMCLHGPVWRRNAIIIPFVLAASFDVTSN